MLQDNIDYTNSSAGALEFPDWFKLCVWLWNSQAHVSTLNQDSSNKQEKVNKNAQLFYIDLHSQRGLQVLNSDLAVITANENAIKLKQHMF